MAVVKTALNEIASPGDCLRYTIIVTNNGPDTAKDVLLTDNVPPQMLQPGFKVNGGEIAAWQGSYLIGDMLPGSTVTVNITGIIYLRAACTLTNIAVVSSPTPDPDLDNNVSSVMTHLLPRQSRSIDANEWIFG